MSLKGCVYFNADFHAPWGMAIGKSDVAQFHLVQRGTCRVSHTDGEEMLATGDIVVFPHGNEHQLYEGTPHEFVDGQQVLRTALSGQRIFKAGDRVTSRVLCGHFEIDRSSRHPLILSLPKLMIVRGLDQGSTGWSLQLAELLLHEQERDLVGSSEIVVRLAESLFIQVLRAYTENDEPIHFLAALRDARLRKALDVIHTPQSSALTLDSLAKQAGMSRSSFADRFKSTVGMAPMKYLSAWQLMQAQKELQSTNKPISIIAQESGYASEAAFSRAFKAHLGIPPSSARRQIVGISSK
jgi:AraC-like DNA-binding protein